MALVFEIRARKALFAQLRRASSHVVRQGKIHLAKSISIFSLKMRWLKKFKFFTLNFYLHSRLLLFF
jgi:hypothetical protein